MKCLFFLSLSLILLWGITRRILLSFLLFFVYLLWQGPFRIFNTRHTHTHKQTYIFIYRRYVRNSIGLFEFWNWKGHHHVHLFICVFSLLFVMLILMLLTVSSSLLRSTQFKIQNFINVCLCVCRSNFFHFIFESV